MNGSGETRNSLGVVENGVKLFLADSYTGSVTFKCNYRAQTEPEGEFEVFSKTLFWHLLLTDTGENVQKWTRVLVLACPLLDVFACGQVLSPRLYRLKNRC